MGFAKTALPKELTKLKHKVAEVDEDLCEIIVGLHVIFSDYKKTVAWLTLKNPNFGNIAPLRLMQIGRSKKVLQFVDNAIYESELS